MSTNDEEMNVKLYSCFTGTRDISDNIVLHPLYHQVYSSYRNINFTYNFSIGKPITSLIIYGKDPNFDALSSSKQSTKYFS